MPGGGPEEIAVHPNKATKPKRVDNAGRKGLLLFFEFE